MSLHKKSQKACSSTSEPLEKMKIVKKLFGTLENLDLVKRKQLITAYGDVHEYAYIGLKECKDFVLRLYEQQLLQREKS